MPVIPTTWVIQMYNFTPSQKVQEAHLTSKELSVVVHVCHPNNVESANRRIKVQASHA
jgi:hypothetical protein